jgi:hypothetical protein
MVSFTRPDSPPQRMLKNEFRSQKLTGGALPVRYRWGRSAAPITSMWIQQAARRLQSMPQYAGGRPIFFTMAR